MVKSELSMISASQAESGPLSLTDNNKKYRLAVLTSHPIQYQVPLFRTLTASPRIDLTVLFCSDYGVKPYYDPGFGQQVKWDVPLTEGYPHQFLPNRSFKPGVGRFWGLVNPGIIKALYQGQFDAVLIHGWARFTNLLTIATAFFMGIPVLMRGETTLLPALPGWKQKLKRFLLGSLFRRVSGFLAIGRYNTDFYRAYGVPEDRIFLAPYAVDNDFFITRAQEYKPLKATLKDELGIPQDLPIILYSGKLTDVKRPMDLLRAFEQVTRNYPAALVYLGDGILREEMEEYVRQSGLSNVIFAGFRNQTELPRFFSAADIFVLPSGLEPWGLVVNEALCFGLPVVVSHQVGACGDLVKDGINGFIFPAGNVEMLAEKIRQLLADAEMRQRMGQASQQIIETWGYREDVQGAVSCLSKVVCDRN
jgi:glycosyltransferase involved in cell wall biosynthesis